MAVSKKGGQRDRWSAEASMAELAQLVSTAGATVVGQLTQQLRVPSRTQYVGKGKLEEILGLKGTTHYNVVIFDDELSPMQQRNIESVLKVKVIDRVALILDIFARHARTSEGQLQVELAQHEYLLPRLAGQWSHLERLGGGIGTRGPGESQLETDRRLIRQRILRIKAKIEDMRKHRRLYRQQRKKSGIPLVALIGYTNSGKSTLLNALTDADILVADKLFATLDPTTRRLTMPDKTPVLFTDTVGFIHNLPPTIVKAFRATLEELAESDILLHVVDLSSPTAPEQCQTVEKILTDLDLADKPLVTALNKIDRLLDKGRHWEEGDAIGYLSQAGEDLSENAVLISATETWGLTKLLETIGQILGPVKK
ncbi:GTPase HflX [Chloroflexota bacterium]